MFKKNLTRKDITNKINKKLGFSKNISSEILDLFFDSLSNELIKKEKVKISSFGTFEVINKKERLGRNPKTRISAKISARKVVRFKPSMIFKKKINNK
ncbi:MAG: integration host factor subunit alpha [Pelagibacterales bacterium]|nr:integration host factor subunit alpha [Pelagibacterales bacterium]